jgi:Cys-tRNA(Pro)/Cys-tRNA(Cys) deacylase
MKKDKPVKTNAVRLLETMGIAYELREYTVDESDLSAPHAAAEIGLPASQVFKTLVVRGDRTGVMLAVVPASAELDLKALAAASGNKKTDLVPLKEVQALTGYIRGGVSPVGTKKKYPVLIDESAREWPFIAVSAGMRGHQMLLKPDDLARAVEASFKALAKE